MTGYTHGVREGKITTLKQFALRCSRAMNPNITMRDESMDAPIRDYEPSPHYAEQLREAEKDLREAEAMTLEESRQRMEATCADLRRVLDASKRENEVTRQRYETMLEMVQAWQPPTPEHVPFKAFMIEQLESSIRFDCSDLPMPEVSEVSPEEYRENAIQRAREHVEDRRKDLQEEIERVKYCNAWNRALRESLESR